MRGDRVFVLTTGEDYEDHEIVGVFPSEEAAIFRLMRLNQQRAARDRLKAQRRAAGKPIFWRSTNSWASIEPFLVE